MKAMNFTTLGEELDPYGKRTFIYNRKEERNG
jgi:hypothetical protein